MKNKLGIRIKELRHKSKLSQKDLGLLLNVSQVAVYKWEKQQTEPDSMTINQLAKIFGVSIDYLIGNTHDPTPRNQLVHKDSIKTENNVIIPIIETKDIFPTIIHENNTIEYKEANPLDIKDYQTSTLFYVQAQDNMMLEAGIPKDAYILFHLQQQLKNNDIGIFKINNTEQLIIRKYLNQEDFIILKGANPSLNEPDLIYRSSEANQKFFIVGKAVKVEYKFK